MRRYLVFAGTFYYPRGGMYDLVGDYSTYREAKAARDAWLRLGVSSPWWAIYDTERRQHVRVSDKYQWQN